MGTGASGKSVGTVFESKMFDRGNLLQYEALWNNITAPLYFYLRPRTPAK